MATKLKPIQKKHFDKMSRAEAQATIADCQKQQGMIAFSATKAGAQKREELQAYIDYLNKILPQEEMIVIVFGSRGWNEYFQIYWRLALLPPGTIVRHGGARGADSMADRAAKALGLEVDPHPVSDAEWQELGPRAGHDRNRRMAALSADLAIGFRMPGKSNGTDGMREEAELRGIPTELHGTGWKEYRNVSSTNRGELSTSNWETPIWCVRRLIEEVYLPAGEWLEPMAGNGRIIRAINEDRPGAIRWTACELRAECAPNLKKQEGIAKLVCPKDFIKDFSPHEHRGKKPAIADPGVSYYDVAITNPVFELAMETVSKLLAISEYVVMLQRLNWLGSGVNNGKNNFLRNCAPDVYVLPDRVKFLIDGKFPRYPAGTKSRDGKKDIGGQLMPGDSIEYAFYVWGPKRTRFREQGTLRNLMATSVEERTELEEAA